MAEKSVLSLVPLLVLVVVTMLVAVPYTYSQEELKYIVVVFTPGVSISSANKTALELNITATILQLELDGPANPDYYAYWLLLGKKPVSDNVTLLTLYSREDAQNYTEKIRSLWSNTVFIDIPVINPELNISAINTGFNLTRNSLRPEILEVPVNGTVRWDQLETNVSAEIRGVELRITLEDYNTTLVIFNVTRDKYTSPRAINITGLENVEDGIYYVSFYVLEVNNWTIKLLFPGSMRTSGYMSQDISPVDAQVVPWTLILQYEEFYKNITDDSAREWIVNLTISTTQTLLVRAISDTDARIYITYAPHILVANILNVTSSVEEKLLGSIITPFKHGFVKRGYLLVMFNPVVDSESGLAVLYGTYTTPSELDLTVSQFISIILSYSQLSPIRNIEVFNEYVRLRERVKVLEVNVTDLTWKVNELNQTLQETTNKLASCESYRDILESKIQHINEELKHAEELRKAAFLYITTGLLVTVALAITLGFLTMRTCRVISPRLRGK